MASDTDATRRKHRRSPDEAEAEKSSKRHKHRHHRHHHRSHRSKKQGEEIKHGDEEIDPSSPPPPPSVPIVANSNMPDDDVEEGEILEEEGSGGVHAKVVELHGEEVVSHIMGVCFENGDSGFTNSNNGYKFDKKVNLPTDDRTDRDNDSRSHVNGDLGHEHCKEGKKHHGEYESSPKVSRKPSDIVAHDRGEAKLSTLGNSSSSVSGVDKYKTVAGSSGRYHDDVTVGSGSFSQEFAGDRSRSHSVIQEDILLKRRRHRERAKNDSEDEGMTIHDHDQRHGSREFERERSTSYSRSFGGEDRYNRDARDREMSWEREMDMERISKQEGERGKDRDREKSRDRDQRKVRDRERSRERDWRKDRDRERSRDRDHRKGRDRERSWDKDQRREKERKRSMDRESDRDRRKEKHQERSWDRDLRQDKEYERIRDKDRRTEKQRERSLDREVDRDRRREREEKLEEKRQKNRDRSKDKYSSRASERPRDRERERENDRDRHSERGRQRDCDWERERERRRDRSSDKGRDHKSDVTKVYNSNTDSSGEHREKIERDDDEQDDFEEKITLKLAEQEEDLDRIKEESRKCRQAILEKYRNKQMQLQNETQLEDGGKDLEPAQHPVVPLPAPLETRDVRTESDAYVAEPSFLVGKSPSHNGGQANARISGIAGLGEGTPKSERSDEKYCDDIFGETPAGIRKSGKGDGLPIVRSGLRDNWDDADGYYGYRFGELLDGRYEIVASHGKGVFSTVVRAKDLKAGAGEPEEVAIKIIRNNETMHKAGQSEVQILNKLAAEDPENKRHCVRFLSSFKYRNHLCLVFESLHMNLREILKKFGRNIGLKLTAVRAYAKQLFIALKHLKNCHVLHCDIKPDNMLVNEAKNVLKLCDFGNAMFSGKNEVTPYLVSRFYRAPEIILGLPYDHPMDIWSVGCCLYELYTGKVLFPGPTNNDMLRLHMELKGPFPKKMLKKGAFVDQHFDQDLNFHATEEDPVTKKTVKRVILNIKPKDIGSIVTSSPGEDPKMLANFKDLLDKVFMLDPEKRMTVNQALLHPFITGK